MPSGQVRAFYRSRGGTGGKTPGQFYPFDGIDAGGWFIKSRYYRDEHRNRLHDPSDPQFGYGIGPDSEDLKEACRIIKEQEFSDSFEELKSDFRVNQRLIDQGIVLDEEAQTSLSCSRVTTA